jgi:hypothetical protein
LRNGHQEKDLRYIKHKENKMPRAKKKTTTTKKRTGRKTTPRRKTTNRRKNEPGDIFWNKVIAGFKKLLSPAFSK